MKKSLIPYLTIPCLVFLVTASTVHARDDDDDNNRKDKDKKHRKEQHDDRKGDQRDSQRGPSNLRENNTVVVRPVVRVEARQGDRRDYRPDEQRIDYRSDRRFDYRDTHRDVTYRTRYPRQVIVYQDRTYGYNYYDMQVVLLREGYYDGPVDGIWGPASRRALARYQSDQGWRDDGVVDGRFIVNFGIGY